MKWSVIPALLFFIGSISAISSPSAIAQQEHFSIEPVAQVQSKPINEMSGIVKSRRRDNLYWVHNDSGDFARIFAIDGNGRSVLPTYSKFTHYGDAAEQGKKQWPGFDVLYAENIDWEDIAIDDNYLYIADMGNNGNARRNLAIYLVSEIDPTASTRSAVIKKLPVVYPDQNQYPPEKLHYDSEALFVANGTPYVITKHRSGGFFRNRWEPGAKLYRLDTRYDDRENELLLVDSHPDLVAATGADLSPDGRTLAVIAIGGLYLFRDPEGDNWFSTGTQKHVPLDFRKFKQAEAITWDSNERLVITNEQGDLFRVDLDALPGKWEAP
jgi:hypothetical protein